MGFSNTIKEKVKKRAHYKCCLCHIQWATHVHHIKPESVGGTDEEDNAAPVCPTCHDLYGGNPDKRKFIRECRDFWYYKCDKHTSFNPEQMQKMIDKFSKFVATKEDLQDAVKLLSNEIQNAMNKPISTSEQLQVICDATAAFSSSTISARPRPTIHPQSNIVYQICGNCGNDFDAKNENCPMCGYPKSS